MFMPFYEFSAPTKSIVDTQKAVHTIQNPVSYTHLTLPTTRI